MFERTICHGSGESESDHVTSDHSGLFISTYHTSLVVVGRCCECTFRVPDQGSEVSSSAVEAVSRCSEFTSR